MPFIISPMPDDGGLRLAPPPPTVAPAPPPPTVAPAPPPPTVAPAPPPPAATTIPLPGHAYLPGEDVGGTPGTLVPAPPKVEPAPPPVEPPADAPPADDPDFDAAAAAADANDPDNGDLPDEGVTDLFGIVEFDADSRPLKGGSALEAIAQGCADFGLDARAVCGDCLGEGAAGGIGDGGNSYGPFQMNRHGALPEPYRSHGLNNPTTNAWAWSRNGIRYALRGMCTSKPSARGLTGHAAVYAIVYGFERPDDKPKAYRLRSGYYDDLVRRDSGWVDYMATKLAGPAGQTATDTSPQTDKPATPKKPAAIQQDWRDLLDVFRVNVPKGHASIKSNSEGMVNIFR